MAGLTISLPSEGHAQRSVEWPAYGSTAGGTRYSRAVQINRRNVSRLTMAWEFGTGDMVEGRGRMQVTPIVVEGSMYVATPAGTIIALDPQTGRERWRHIAKVDLKLGFGDAASRGVAFWRDSRARRNATCSARIFFATVDARLLSLDAASGRLCVGFGQQGTINLKRGLHSAPSSQTEYEVTSPPAILGDLVIVGSAIADNQRVDAPEGVVRAYDARTGEVRWAWDPHPPAGEPGSETWRGPSGVRSGAANAWSMISVDAQRGLIFVPTGSPSPDFFGGERIGQNLYANSLVALRAADGEVAWHFQVVHHDIWDYDIASQPVLFTLRRGRRAIPAVAQATKMGHLFILNRETGEPLFPVEERPVPASDVAGEEAWPTQPFPELPKPLVPHEISPADAFGIDDAERQWCTTQMTGKRNEGIFTPPSLQGSILFPGNIGGSNWGGVAIDEARQIAIVPTNRVPTLVRLVPRNRVEDARRQNPNSEYGAQRGTPYAMQRLFLISPKGIPCSPPPWGALTAIDLRTGEVKWEKPLGFMPQLADNPESRNWGSLNLGGAAITAGGLVFIGATLDQKVRAFDIETGEELWSADLPAAGMATPMTFTTATGRQYVVIAAGGHDRIAVPRSDKIMAFALPR